MKLTLGVCVLACVLAICAAANQYTNKFDNVDVDSVLGNDRILKNYIKCLNDKGPCTPEGRELKKLLPDALATDCASCTEVQRTNSRKVIRFLHDNHANDWKILLERYDPRGAYRAKHGL